MDRFRKIIDILVMDIAIHALIGIDLSLPVRDNIRDYDFVIDDETHIPGEYLVAIGNKRRSVNLNAIFLENGLKCLHFADYVGFLGVNPVLYRLV